MLKRQILSAISDIALVSKVIGTQSLFTPSSRCYGREGIHGFKAVWVWSEGPIRLDGTGRWLERARRHQLRPAYLSHLSYV